MTSGSELLFSSDPPKVTLASRLWPAPTATQVLIQHHHTCVSIGTETNFLREGATGYGSRERPGTVPLGYMAVGQVIATGPMAHTVQPGDRVFTSSPHASHSLVDTATSNPLDPLPANTSEEAAGFAALGDVALHAVRRAQLQIDESVAVVGIGMVGQLVIQFARLAGAHPIIAVDVLGDRLALARQHGATAAIDATSGSPADQLRQLTSSEGVAKAFLCAGAARALDPILPATADRGTVLITGSPHGSTSLSLREHILRKELTFTGTYERDLQANHPYWPWSRARNRRTFLRRLADGDLNVLPLISHRIPAAQAPEFYDQLQTDPSRFLGVVLDWSDFHRK